VGHWLRVTTLVIGLSALVMAILAAFAPGTVAAADIAFVAENPKVMGAHCSDAPTAIELDRNYGTFSGCWAEFADHIVSANPDQTGLELELSGRFGRGRSYGTFVDAWTDPVDHEATVNPDQTALELELSGRFGQDRSYGTFVDAWTGQLDHEAAASPDQTNSQPKREPGLGPSGAQRRTPEGNLVHGYYGGRTHDFRRRGR
jgi:hypothetical protein